MWYLKDSRRFTNEQAELASLQAEGDWLTIEGRRLDAGKLIIDIEIQVGDRTYPAMLRYPSTFPHSPPSVLPRSPARWSGHQYGQGELCLEWGPDTWQPTLTGADMVRSAYKLLVTEAPNSDELVQAAPDETASSFIPIMRDSPSQ